MKYGTALVALAVGLASARDVPTYSLRATKREVPQEHSHEAVLRACNVALKLNNPLNILDCVFPLLGNAAAANGAGDVTADRLDCLQQIVADQALTNAKAANDLDLATNAILFRALERNTLSVGEASPLCNETPVNAELLNIAQHQDPASAEAANNAQVELEVAKALFSIGADPLIALQSGTFAPGEIGDPTAAGNTCNDENDAIGCIISQNLLVPAVSEADILAAVGDQEVCEPVVDDEPAVEEPPVVDDGAAEEEVCEPVVDDGNNNGGGNDDNAEVPTGTVNVQTFTGALGGPAPAVISDPASNRPFSVNGNTFLNAGAAIQRSCAIQKNACANAANSGQIQGGAGQCDQQESQCLAAASRRKARRSTVGRRQNVLDFGSCGSPAIQFAAGLDGRQEESFQPVNAADFSHGSALNINIISSFVCQRLDSSCKASPETVEACEEGAQAASQAEGAQAASVFNAALGL
ncbi:hypothetical protein B0T21DRAFT_381019 [Apiosordaria backusii]|uniref:Uncharacterized protein n=1 Tax=Apiosordaria backusii TaxID=314023 RepID=A0AA40ET41_9PEZI|nr:hypothetical protein B0T21DRAFT_381019 [Apiosordaria backusii]